MTASSASSPDAGTGAGVVDRAAGAPDFNRRLYELACDVERCMRYHAYRRAHFELLHRLIMLGVLLAGSAVVSKEFGDPAIFGFAAAILASLDMVYNFAPRARDHEFLYRRFAELDADILGADPTSQTERVELERRYRRIVADEPTCYRALNARCHNEVMIAQGQDRKWLVPLTFWQRLLMHWKRYETAEFRTGSAG